MKIGQFGDMDVNIHSQAAGETLVEWLRHGCCADCPADCETCLNLREAADRIEALQDEITKLELERQDKLLRIEALERENADLRHDNAQLVDCEADKEIERLRAALRKIASEPIPEQSSLWTVAFESLRDIARAALEGK